MDIQAQLKKVRSDAAECSMLSSLASDGKQEVFARMAEHLNALASEIEKTIANGIGKGAHNALVPEIPPADQEETLPAPAVVHRKLAAPPLPILLGFVMVCLAGIVAAFFGTNKQGGQLPGPHSNQETSQASRDEANRAIATLLSADQVERKMWADQMGALVARLDRLVTTLENFKTSNAEIAGPLNNNSPKERRTRRGQR